MWYGKQQQEKDLKMKWKRLLKNRTGVSDNLIKEFNRDVKTVLEFKQ